MPNAVNNPEPDTAPQDAPAAPPPALPLHPPTPDEIAATLSFSLTSSRRRSDILPPRPLNGFLCFRHVISRRLQFDAPATDLGALSVRSAMLWRGMGEEEKRPWQRVADEQNKEHRRLYPNYMRRAGRQAGGRGAAV